MIRFSSAFVLLSAMTVACSSADADPAGTPDAGIDAQSQPHADSGPSAHDAATSPEDAAHDDAAPADAAHDGATATDASEAGEPDSAPGTSPYAEACGASTTCSGAGLTCQKFSFGGGAIHGYACTQTCQTTNDCAPSPTGVAASECLAFTSSKYCVLTCDASKTNGCPDPLKCVADQGAPTGICVHL